MTDVARRFPAWPDQGADALEQDLLARWKAEDLFQTVQRARADGTPFVFYEGPPTANGRPGIHHVFSRTLKDLFPRFRVMQGRSVTRIAGWDTHGLPVEIEVEKKLNLKGGKKDIEAFGVAEFNRLCLESVFTYKQDWQELSNRIGYWLDYDRPYITCSPQYVESVWWLLKQLHQKDLLIRGHRVLPYCPRCGTVLSSHELAQGYESVKDKSIYVTFPLESESGRELVVWTTTPWTLPSNVAAAVHPKLEYAAYRHPTDPNRQLIVAVARSAALASMFGVEALEQVGAGFPGSTLEGERYRRPLDVVPLPPEGHHSVVVSGDFVTAQDGSGIVHMAPAFGSDDYEMGKRFGLALLRPVAADGTFAGTTWPELEGKLVTADETNELLIRKLKALGRHLKTEQHVHDYPHCWRCKSKLIYYARDSWFVKTSAVKQRMVELNAQVHWQPPETGSGRFGDWLSNNVDWALSRDRYWGTPLPVWVSDRDPAVVEVIGSYDELFARLGKPRPADFDPHKPAVDALTWPAPDGGTMRRVPEVIDTWFDSGSMPYAQWHYPFENQDVFTRHFPADFIAEGIDQTRGWFYSLLAIATTVFDQLPYRNVVVNDLLLDAQGQKMAKSRGNIVDPWEVIREYGADTIRLFLLASGEVWRPRRFDRTAIAEVAGAFMQTLKSTYSFLQLFAGDTIPERNPALEAPLDQWLRSRLAATVNATVEAWERYDPTNGLRPVLEFVVDDLSNWYVRRSKPRFWAPDKDAEPAAVRTLYDALLTVARLMAPAAPFASDWVHRALTGESVHLAAFPAAGQPRNLELEQAMDAIRRLSSLARAAREDKSIKVRQPLGALRVALPRAADTPLFRSLLPVLADEVNVKRIEVVASDTDLVRLKGKANFRSLGKRYGKRTPEAAAAASGLSAEQLRRLESGEVVRLDSGADGWEYHPEDVTVEREVATDWAVQSAGSFVAALDPAITSELQSEGLARELVNRVQRLRKDAGYEYTYRIDLWVDGAPAVLEAARRHDGFIQGETLARTLQVGTRAARADKEETVELDGHPVVIAVARHSAVAA